MPEGSPFPKALTEAYGGAPPWRKLAAWGVAFALGLLLVGLALAVPELRGHWWTTPILALVALLMLASVAAVAFDLPRARKSGA